jgi:hypothetical protein
MIARLLFYLLEAALLAAVVVFIALPLISAALKRLGYHATYRAPQVFLLVGVVFLALGVAGGELAGPQFLWVYKVVGLAVVAGVTLWLAAPLLSRHVRIERAGSARASDDPT